MPVKDLAKNTLFNLSYPILNKLSRFYNLHAGESCYIFGDGISVKQYDLKKFSDRISIVNNYIPFHKDFEELDAPYCVLAAPFFFSPYFGYQNPAFKKYLYTISHLYREQIAKYTEKNFFVSLSNYPFIRNKNIYFNFSRYADKRLPPDFLSNRINCFTGVMRNSVSLAIYLGFTDIHLVGCDYTFSPTQQLHWYEKGTGSKLDMPGYEKDFFTIATEFANITTVTLDAKSDMLDYTSYQELTGAEPIYRENYQLLDDKYMKALATWSGYSIY